jgi:hypothetical protein
MTWHADAGLLDRYARGDLGDVEAASVEAHVTGCDQCRRMTAPYADHRALEQIKQSIDEHLDAPRIGRAQLSLERIGLNDRDARLLAGSLSLETSWCAASLITLCFALLAANLGSSRTSLALFLVVAPLVPLAGVAFAFGRRVDPTFEIALSCPLPQARILMVRTVAIVGLALPVLVLLSVPFGVAVAFAWLLPALALAAATLAAGTFIPLSHAAGGLAVLWMLGASAALADAPRTTAEAFARSNIAFQGHGQVLCAVLAVVSLAVLAARHHSYEVTR